MLKLSVVIPVYNAEKYLRQCIDSVLGQTFSDFELILVDDGSTDGSGGICDLYVSADPRARVIHTKNQGVVAARRAGVNLARGEYVACVDSDDWLDLDFYRSLFELSDESDADILICSHVVRGEERVETTAFSPGYYDKMALEDTVYSQMMYNLNTGKYHITPSLWDKLFRTELLRKVYENVDTNVTLGDDAACTYPCLTLAQSIYILDNRSCYHYREGHFSMVHHCDIQLLQRICALASSMELQFEGSNEIIKGQMYNFVAYNAVYAVRQILVNNQSLRLRERIQAINNFLTDPVITHSLLHADEETCATKTAWKLHMMIKKRLYLLSFTYNVFEKINNIRLNFRKEK